MTSDYSHIRRVLIVGFVLALVAQPMVGSAAAATTDDDCSPDDTEDLVLDMVTADFRAVENALDGGSIFDYNGGIVTDDNCFSQQQLEEQTKVRVYQAALTAGDISGDVETIQNNHLEDSRTFAATIAKREILVGIENGDNLSTIEQNVNQSINDYYATIQTNILASYRTTMNDLYYQSNISMNYGSNFELVLQDTGSDDSTGTIYGFAPNAPETTSSDTGRIDLINETVTLVNGSNYSLTKYVYHPFDYDLATFSITNPGNGGGGPEIYALHPDYDRDIYESTGDNGYTGLDGQNANLILDNYKWYQTWNQTQNIAEQMKANYAGPNGVAEQAINQVNASEFDANEFVDANTLATQFSTNYDSTGYYGWRAAEAALLGWNGTLNESFSITYDPAGTTTTYSNTTGNITSNTTELGPRNMTGVLYTNWAPNSTNGSFDTGATYNTSNADSPVYFINQTTSNTTNMVALDGTFTINEMTNVRTGGAVNSTTLEEQNRQTANVSATLEEMQRLLELEQNAIESYDTSGGGSGGGGGDWFNFGDLSLGGAALGGLVALGAALILLGDGIPGSGN